MARWIVYPNPCNPASTAFPSLLDSSDTFVDVSKQMKFELPDQQASFGYLSAVHSPDHGCFGGYMIVSSLGRPLEFHCTAPVCPTRAQEILYGPTLKPYLFGEQIRGSLLGAAKIQPHLILTDQPAAIGEAPPAGTRLVLARSIDGTAGGEADKVGMVPGFASNPSFAVPHRLAASWSAPFTLFNCEFRLPANDNGDPDDVIRLLTHLAERVDLLEPFGRIHEAIREAQRIGGRSSEVHGRAA
jgi:hypothetical protein